jgi:hypothetical protein
MRYSPVIFRDGESGDGAHACDPARGQSNHGLRQSGRHRQDVSIGASAIGSRRHGQVQPARARLAGARGRLLRHRVGAVHAVVLPRSTEVPARRPAVVGRPRAHTARGRQLGDLAGPHAPGLGAAAPTPRRGGQAHCGGGDSRRVVWTMALGEPGRQHDGCGGRAGQR